MSVAATIWWTVGLIGWGALFVWLLHKLDRETESDDLDAMIDELNKKAGRDGRRD